MAPRPATQTGDQAADADKAGQDRRGLVDDGLLADIARSYYLDDLSMVEIARTFGLSRFKVARCLHLARVTGIVKISVAAPAAANQPLSEQLAERLELTECVVVDTTGSAQNARDQVAGAAALVLPRLVKDGDLLGLTWSRTVESTVDQLTELPSCSVVQLAGSFSPTLGDGLDLVHRAARLSGGVAYAVHAPLVVDDPDVATALRRQPGIADTLRRADRLDVSVISIGAWKAGCSTVWEAVPWSIREAALEAGAVAEVTGRLLGADGQAIDSLLDRLVISASLEQLRDPVERLALATGPDRAAPIVAAVRAGLVTRLVTTAQVARILLRMPNPLDHDS
jgi:DNA-binding transcriptional regulator LsrR (DeoR family)